MRDRHAVVTRDVTRDSQHPVPTRPDPTRPALYRSRGHLPSIRPVGDAGEPRIGWMANSSSPVTTPERRDGQPHPAERLAVACPDLSTIEGIDLDAEVPCAYQDHQEITGAASGPADYIVLTEHPACGHKRRSPICEACFSTLMRSPLLRCSCWALVPSELVRIVEVLR